MQNFKPEGLTISTPQNQKILSSPSNLHEACAAGAVVEARALLCDKDHNLRIDLGCMYGIIPHSEGALGIEDGTVRDIALISRVNKPVMFKILSFSRDSNDREYAILSRRDVQQDCMDNYISKLRPGDVISARVAHMENFGVFLDIGAGINGLLPIDSISVSRIPHPSVRFSIGQMIRVVVKSIDELGRITFTHKELLGTWEQNADEFSPGETVPGIVRSIENYGIFVELTPNLAGLAEYSAGITAGCHAGVYIKSMLPERMKIKLIIVDAFQAEYPSPPIKYYTDCDHIDRWVYSPKSCSKVIESTFN
ncbi:MAG: S1 RNA-binding domain-containing protein [Clostridia bacterium]|nr:S1 RNA-binding domain-containing protein [Clostridia bacterium]